MERLLVEWALARNRCHYLVTQSVKVPEQCLVMVDLYPSIRESQHAFNALVWILALGHAHIENNLIILAMSNLRFR